MRRPKTLHVFTDEEYSKAHFLLASRVATMMGRKMEEGDWSYVYCNAKGIPDTGWSNLEIDVMHEGLGVELKMLCVKSNKVIKEYCGTTQMHPAATRSIRVPSQDGDPTEVACEVLAQYTTLIEERRDAVAAGAADGKADMRTGWLLWQVELREFLYFEEEMLPPTPEDYRAVWMESGGGRRKRSKNLWVYENKTGKKRYSITTGAGAKIQPYFDVPPPDDPHLCYFCAQGELLPDKLVRIWVTQVTALCLSSLLGSLETEALSRAIAAAAEDAGAADELGAEVRYDLLAQPLTVTAQAYARLRQSFPGVSDEHMMQLFALHLRNGHAGRKKA